MMNPIDYLVMGHITADLTPSGRQLGTAQCRTRRAPSTPSV
jgi:hypothetical protein